MMVSARPLAGLHTKLDLIWHLFSNINILFWWENSWRCQHLVSDAWNGGCVLYFFGWLSWCRADWNELAIVYQFFWSDPSLWTWLSWPWPLRPLSHWPEAAVYTLCHVHIVDAVHPNYQSFSPLSLLIYILFVRNVFLAWKFCQFQVCYFPLLCVCLS